MDGKLYAAVGALIFAGTAAFIIKTGRYKTREFKVAPYVRGRDHPASFWTYVMLLLAASAVLAYIAIFVA